MKKLLMTLAVFGAAAAARAQEETKKPSIVCADGKCNEPPAAETTREPGERFLENLKFEVYGIADIALLYRDQIATNGKDGTGGLQSFLTLISGGRNQSRIGLRGFYKLGTGTRALIELEKGVNYMDGTIANNARVGGGGMYTTGPLSALFVYDQRNLTMTSAGLPKEQAGAIFLRYRLLDNLLTPIVGVRRYVKSFSPISDTLWIMGLQIRPIDKWTFVIADYFDNKTDGTGQDNNLFVLRANYALGKIVEMYTTYGHASSSNGGLAGVMRANDAAPVSGYQNGFSLGFRIRYGYPAASSAD